MPLPLPIRVEAVAMVEPPKAVVKKFAAGASFAKAEPIPPGAIEVCGVGWVSLPPDASASDAPPPDWQRQWEAQAETLRAQAVATLQARGDAFSRVLARLIQNDTEGAAAAAAGSSDPRAYGLAWQACSRPGAGPACQQLSLRRWTQLEPGNAWPWLGMLSEARQRGDASGVEEALHRAAGAETMDGGFGRFTGGIDEALPADAPVGARSTLQLETIGRESAFALGWLGAGGFSSSCSAEAVRDANRRQNCVAIAKLLASKGRGLVDVAIGARVGERLGLSADEIDVTPAQVKAAQQAFPVPEELASCAALRQMQDWMREVARDGEWRALQARLPPKS
ncbi:hypothetical protein [Roseateles violae]|nr:hypothetical protein [Pelomonas sp. PFR6]